MTSPTIETNIEKILDQINQNLAEFRKEAAQNLAEFRKETAEKLDKLTKDVTDLKVGQAEIRGDIKALSEKVQGINERLKSVEFINRSLGVGIVLAVAAAIIKLFFPDFLGSP